MIRRLVLALTALAFLVAGCSSGTSGDSSSIGADGGTGAAPTEAIDVQTERIERGQVVVEVDELDGAARAVQAVAEDVGGTMSDENVGGAADSVLVAGGPHLPGDGEARLVLRIPPPQLDAAIDAVGALGDERSRSRSSEDVTTVVADVESRVATQEASIDRVRALLADTTSVTDLINLEGALTTRTAELESLQAQRRSVTDQVEMATLTAVLQRPDAVASPGLVGGLRGGWNALVTTARVSLAVLGAVLPFAVVGGVVAGAVVLVRRRSTG